MWINPIKCVKPLKTGIKGQLTDIGGGGPITVGVHPRSENKVKGKHNILLCERQYVIFAPAFGVFVDQPCLILESVNANDGDSSWMGQHQRCAL